MAYDTNFHFIDKVSGAVLWLNVYLTCFAKWVTHTFDDKEKGFGPGRVMEVWCRRIRMPNTVISFEERVDITRRFVEAVNTRFGYNVVFKIEDRQVPKAEHYDISKIEMITCECFVFTLDLDEFKSKHELKIILYLLRNCYEENGVVIIKSILENCSTMGFVKAYIFGCKESRVSLGHTVVYTPGLYPLLDSTKDLDAVFVDQLEKFKSKEYTANDTWETMDSRLRAAIEKKTIIF